MSKHKGCKHMIECAQCTNLHAFYTILAVMACVMGVLLGFTAGETTALTRSRVKLYEPKSVFKFKQQ